MTICKKLCRFCKPLEIKENKEMLVSIPSSFKFDKNGQGEFLIWNKNPHCIYFKLIVKGKEALYLEPSCGRIEPYDHVKVVSCCLSETKHVGKNHVSIQVSRKPLNECLEKPCKPKRTYKTTLETEINKAKKQNFVKYTIKREPSKTCNCLDCVAYRKRVFDQNIDSQPILHVLKTSTTDFQQKIPGRLAGTKYSSVIEATNHMYDTDIVNSGIPEKSSLQEESEIYSHRKKTYDRIDKIDAKAQHDEDSIEKGKIDHCKCCCHFRESTKEKRKHSQDENITIPKSISHESDHKSLLIPICDVLRDGKLKKKYENNLNNIGKTKISSDPGACSSKKHPVTSELQASFTQVAKNAQNSGGQNSIKDAIKREPSIACNCPDCVSNRNRVLNQNIDSQEEFGNTGGTKYSSDRGAGIYKKHPVTPILLDFFNQTAENAQDSAIRDPDGESCDISDDRIKRIMDQKSLRNPISDNLRDEGIKEKHEKNLKDIGKKNFSSDCSDSICAQQPVLSELQAISAQVAENAGISVLEEVTPNGLDVIEEMTMDTSGSVPGRPDDEMRLREIFAHDVRTYLEEILKLSRHNYYLLTTLIAIAVCVITCAFIYGSGSQVNVQSKCKKCLYDYLSEN